MKKFLETLVNIYKIEELRNRLGVTFNSSHLSLWSTNHPSWYRRCSVSRLGNRTGGGGLLGVLNMFTGGALLMHQYLH